MPASHRPSAIASVRSAFQRAAPLGGDQLAAAERVQVLHDHLRLDELQAVVGDQRRDLHQRVVLRDVRVRHRGIGRLGHLLDPAIEPVLDGDDHHLAHEGRERRVQKLHRLGSPEV
jgi:hypothetical protein